MAANPRLVSDPAIVETLRSLWERRTVPRLEGEGLRDRKKRILRQQISDTATLMFLQRGFDEVKVSEIADECGVSEKTIYNYFPTKESLLFDHEEALADQLADAFSDRQTTRSLVEIAVGILTQNLDDMFDTWAGTDAPPSTIAVIREFGELIERTPALQAGMHGMTERLTQVAALALAERAGVDPDDPEPQLAAIILMGLWRVQFRSMHRYADGTRTMEDVRRHVLADIRRAARVADSGLTSFNLVLQRNSTKQQVQEAADAANEARRQVIAAVKQARDAWKQVAVEARSLHDIDDQKEQLKEQIKRDQRAARQQLRENIREHQRLQREQQAARRRR
ncbi:MAG: TetR family transcriptional regulator [Acidimicrobiales bacterium]